MNTFYLVDGHSHLYRAYFAIRGMTAPSGQPTNAVFGFISTLMKIRREREVDYLAVALDAKGPTFRHERYKEYKATRAAMPDDLGSQIPLVRRALEVMGVPVYDAPGFEADDVMGTLARQAAAEGLEVFLVTGDKDAKQLIGPQVHLYEPRDDAVLDEAGLREELGITPRQMIDMLALAGDSSDNVPGVRGIGPKTALALIDEYGDLDAILAHAGEIKAKKRREALLAHADDARLSRELVTIRTDVPVTLDVDRCAVNVGRDDEAARAFFEELDFRRFLGELSAPAEAHDCAVEIVRSEADLARVVVAAGDAAMLAVDVETTGTRPMDADLVGISLAWEPDAAVYIPILSPEGGLPLECVRDAIGPVLADADVPKCGQNIKFDMIVLRRSGMPLGGVAFDTMIASYLLDPGRRRHSLSEIAGERLGRRMQPISELIGKDERTMAEVPLDEISPYAGADAETALALVEGLREALEAAGLAGLFAETEMPLVEVLAEMEFAGIRLETSVLEQIGSEFQRRIDDLAAEIHEAAGGEFNISSPKQVAEVLFDRLGLPAGKGSKGRSTRSAVLEDLSLRHPLPRQILDYRALTKLKSTYVDALPGWVSPATGRIHASFNQTVTATGRLSSSDPNLQNIPIRSEEGRLIRGAFVPADGQVFVAADYSQVELRILAHLSRDEGLFEAFRAGEDIHAAVAREVFAGGGEVTPEMRSRAKAVNFGVIYGQSAFGLARQIGVPMKEAAAFIEAYFKRFAGVKSYCDELIARARETGRVETILGRRRAIPQIDSRNQAERGFAERTAINTTVQGSAADLMKVAMLNIHRRLQGGRLEARVLIQLHDELLIETPSGAADEAGELLRSEMTGAFDLDVPLEVKVSIGTSWMDV